MRNLQARFNSNPDANEAGAHVATVSVDLVTAEQRVGNLDDIIRAMSRSCAPCLCSGPA